MVDTEQHLFIPAINGGVFLLRTYKKPVISIITGLIMFSLGYKYIKAYDFLLPFPYLYPHPPLYSGLLF
jgi:hypothetical protein